MTFDLQQTGERFLPWHIERDPLTAYEHIHRYLLASQFVAGKRVLDVSSGEGYGTAMLGRVATSVVGIDNDAATVHHAQRYHLLPNIHYIRADARHFGLRANSIDVAVSFETIEHLDDQDSFLASVKHTLKANGMLIISTPHKGIYHDADYLENPFHLRELTHDAFVALLGKYFKHVHLLGQKVIASSLMAASSEQHFPIDGGSCCFATTNIDQGQLEFPLNAESELAPRYYLAFCSESKLPKIANSLMVDNRETLFRSFLEARAEMQAEHERRVAQHEHLQAGRKQTVAHHERLQMEYERLRFTFEEQQEDLDRLTRLVSTFTEREQRFDASLLSAHVQLADRDDEIRRLTVIADSLDSHSRALERASHDQQAHIHDLEQHVGHLGEEIARKDGHLTEIGQYVAHLDEEIARKDEYLAHLGEEIARKDGHLTEIGQYVAHLDEEIARKDEYLAHLGEEIARKDEYLAHLERHCREQAAWAEQLAVMARDEAGHQTLVARYARTLKRTLLGFRARMNGD